MAGTVGSGGKRSGSGRKKKPLAEKLIDGKMHRTPIKVLDFGKIEDLDAVQVPKPRDYLINRQKQGELISADIRAELWKWLKERKCAHLVPMLLVDQYSQTYSRWIQSEEARSEYGALSKHPTSGNPIASPFVTISQNENKLALNLWNQIYGVVRENCSKDYGYGGDPDDPMERLLSKKPRGMS